MKIIAQEKHVESVLPGATAVSETAEEELTVWTQVAKVQPELCNIQTAPKSLCAELWNRIHTYLHGTSFSVQTVHNKCVMVKKSHGHITASKRKYNLLENYFE